MSLRYAFPVSTGEDLLPTLPLFDTDFSRSQQLVLRVCLDSLHRHCHYGCKDLFWGSPSRAWARKASPFGCRPPAKAWEILA